MIILAIIGATCVACVAPVALFAGVNMFLLWIDPANKKPEAP